MKKIMSFLSLAFIVTAIIFLAVDVDDGGKDSNNPVLARSEAANTWFNSLDDFIEVPLLNWFRKFSWPIQGLIIVLGLAVLVVAFILLVGMVMYQSGGLQRMKDDGKVEEHLGGGIFVWILLKIFTR